MQKLRIRTIYVLLLLCVSITLGSENAKYIFLFIGDGMGENHCIAADYYLKNQQAAAGTQTAKGLVFNEFPVRGKVSTFSKNSDVTDSAAAATALSSGHKVNNGALNFDVETGRVYEPMGLFAKKQGREVGIVSSAPINHATPAAFYAQIKGRGDYYDIAVQMAACDIDYFGGQYQTGIQDGKDNIKELAAGNGFKIVDNRQDFDALKPAAQKVWIYSQMASVIDGKHSITLADYTAKAIDMLKGQDGFFIMVEGGQVDWAAHSNDGAAMVYEMQDFNDAIKQAFDFYTANPDDTLILVTADHETGALSLDKEKLAAPGMSKIIDAQKGSRSASAEVFKTIEKQKLNFDEALPLMMEFFGAQQLSDAEKESVRTAFNDGGEAKGDFSYGDNKKISLAWVRLVSARAGMNWGSLGHSGVAVPLYAIGVQSQRFSGNLDNTLVCWYLRELIAEGVGAKQEQAK